MIAKPASKDERGIVHFYAVTIPISGSGHQRSSDIQHKYADQRNTSTCGPAWDARWMVQKVVLVCAE